MLVKLLKGFSGLFEREQEGKLDSDFEFDYTFRYLQKSCHPALFDIRDEVCMPIGGYKHGDLVKCGGHTMVVIGVRPEYLRNLPSLDACRWVSRRRCI